MAHKIVHEALQRLRFEAFLQKVTDVRRNEIKACISSMHAEYVSSDFHGSVTNQIIQNICKEYEDFITEKSFTSETFAF